METLLENIRKYNTWEGLQFNIGFERSSFLEQIKSYIGNKLTKVIVGQRRTGKSYIMRQIMNYLISEHAVNPKNIFYVNKEYTAFDDISTMRNFEEVNLQHCYPVVMLNLKFFHLASKNLQTIMI